MHHNLVNSTPVNKFKLKKSVPNKHELKPKLSRYKLETKVLDEYELKCINMIQNSDYYTTLHLDSSLKVSSYLKDNEINYRVSQSKKEEYCNFIKCKNPSVKKIFYIGSFVVFIFKTGLHVVFLSDIEDREGGELNGTDKSKTDSNKPKEKTTKENTKNKNVRKKRHSNNLSSVKRVQRKSRSKSK